MEKFINISLLQHPLNWFTVVFMLIIFGFAADIVLRKFKKED